MSLKEALSTWLLSCFELNAQADLSDGTQIAAALHKIDSAHFSSKWAATIKVSDRCFDVIACRPDDTLSRQRDIPRENVRLKANNVKKVTNAILEYYSDVLGIQMTDFPIPDVTKVAEGEDENTGETEQRFGTGSNVSLT